MDPDNVVEEILDVVEQINHLQVDDYLFTDLSSYTFITSSKKPHNSHTASPSLLSWIVTWALRTGFEPGLGQKHRNLKTGLRIGTCTGT